MRCEWRGRAASWCSPPGAPAGASPRPRRACTRRTSRSTRRSRIAVPCRSRSGSSPRARAAPVVAAGRSRVAAASRERWSVPPTLVEGAPVVGGGLAGIHVVGACGRSRLLVEGERVHGRVVEGRHARFLGLADVGRRLPDARGARPADEALAVLEAALALLEGEGFSFHDVVRTWFYLRDILGWYGSFNARSQRLLRAARPRRRPWREPDPREHRHRGHERARQAGARSTSSPCRPRPAAALETQAAPQPPAERGDRVRLGLRPSARARGGRRAQRARVRDGGDRRSRRERSPRRLRARRCVHTLRGGRGATRRRRRAPRRRAARRRRS